MTQQPKKFLMDNSANTTNEINISWTLDTSGGILEWDLTTTGLSLPHIDTITLQIRTAATPTPNTGWSTVSSNLSGSTRSYQFDLGTTYGGINMQSDTEVDVRIYGTNQAKATAGGDSETRALYFYELKFKGAGVPQAPTFSIGTLSSPTSIPITITCADVDVDDPNVSTLSVNSYDVSYISHETTREGGLYDSNDKTYTNNSFGPFTQSQIASGRTSTISSNIHPGTSYRLQIRVKNDSNNNYGEFSTITTTNKTKLPSALGSTPSTITNCFNTSQSTMTFYDGNTSSNATAHYINSATTSNVLTFNQNGGTIRFECTNPSTDPDTNTKYGSLVTATEDLVTLSVTSGTTLKIIPNDMNFRKDTVDNGSNNDFFTSMTSTDPNSTYNEGFRVRGQFTLVDITTAFYSASNSSHSITYNLISNISSSKFFNSNNDYKNIYDACG